MGNNGSFDGAVWLSDSLRFRSDVRRKELLSFTVSRARRPVADLLLAGAINKSCAVDPVLLNAVRGVFTPFSTLT